MTLDANTVISSSSFTLSFRGANAVNFDSANISTLTLTNVLNGTGVINSTNILDGTIVGADISSNALDFTSFAQTLNFDGNLTINQNSGTETNLFFGTTGPAFTTNTNSS